jgi:hypothetical protein
LKDEARKETETGSFSYATLYPEPEKGGRGKNVESRKAAETSGFSARRLAQARSVFHFSRPMAEAILKGCFHQCPNGSAVLCRSLPDPLVEVGIEAEGYLLPVGIPAGTAR